MDDGHRDMFLVIDGTKEFSIADANTAGLTGLPTNPLTGHAIATPAGGGQNLVTSYYYDSEYRLVETLGSTHGALIDGQIETVRTATWTVYDDAADETWTAQGYETIGGAGSWTIVNPISVSIYDQVGHLDQQIEATIATASPTTIGWGLSQLSFDESGTVPLPAGLDPLSALVVLDEGTTGGIVGTAPPQTSYTAWTVNGYSHDLQTSTKVYFNIPSSGSGTAGVNYNQTNFGYDSLGRLQWSETPNGTFTYNVLDYRGLVTSTWAGTDDGGLPALAKATQSPSMTPTASGSNMIDLVDYYYDGSTPSTTISGGDGLLTAQVQHVDGNSADDRVTLYGYDSRDELTSVTAANGTVTSYTYDNLGEVTETQEYSSGVLIAQSATAYNPLGEVYQTSQFAVDPTNGTVGPALTQTTSYDADGNVIQTTDALGNLTEYKYDGLDRQIAVIQPNPLTGGTGGPTSTAAYDADGNVTAQTDALGNVTSFLYDGVDRQVEEIQPIPEGSTVGPTTVNAYNAAGNLASTTDPLGNVTSYQYDNAGREISETDPLGGATSYAYDGDGNTTSLTDPDGNTTTWTYDEFDRMATSTNQLSGSNQYFYDLAGDLLESIDADGRAITYQYDHLGRETGEEWYNDASDAMAGTNATDVIAYTYSSLGELATAADNFSSHSYAYDGYGRETTETVSNTDAPTVVLNQQYDADSNRTQLSATIAGTADFVDNYTYNGLSEVTSISQSGGNAVADKLANFTYTADEQLATVNTYADLAATQLVVTSTYSYDAIGRLTSLTHAQGATTLAGYTYSYDADGNVLQTTSVADGTTTYTYDANGELTSANNPNIPAESFSYDANGNQTSTGHSTGTNNELLSDGTFNYTYDACGNCTSKTQISTSASNDYITLYTWDNGNRLASVTLENNAGQVTETIDYTYDVFNRLISRTATFPGETTQSSAYVYDGTQMILQFEAAGPGPLQASDLSHRYLWNPAAVDQLMADEQVTTPTAAGNVVWPLVDNEGSIRDLATYNAGTSTTTVANHIVYSAYGQVLSQTNPSVTTTFGYAGGFTDPDTALVRFGFRWYDPTSTVWISADPSGFYFGGTNPSQYCGGAPTNWADPTGLNDTVYYDPAQLAASWQAAKAAMGSSPDVVAAQVSLQAEINQAAQDEWENSPEGIAWANSPDGIAAAQASLQAQINQVAAAQAARVAAAQSAARLAGLSNTRRALLALTSAAGNQPCERQFWEAVSLAMQLYGSNGMAALADIKDLREKRPDLDNPLLACLDHYFQGFANVAWSGMPWGGLPVWASNLVNSVYSGWKASGIPGLPTDTATPASPITDLQWQAGYWGARDGENYYPQR